MALSYEGDKETRGNAIDAYDRCVGVDPHNVDALLNCGTLYYEEGNLEKAADYFQRSVAAQPQNALATFNLGSVLEELGGTGGITPALAPGSAIGSSLLRRPLQSRLCLREKLHSFAEAREHWQAYVKLDPLGHGLPMLGTASMSNTPGLLPKTLEQVFCPRESG